MGRRGAAARADRCARRAIRAAFDEASAPPLLAEADVVIDATDGARTKDWLNRAAVHASVALVHAAALQSEARLLVVAPGGAPCLACLFGRLQEEGGSCEDLGVWNGAVGTAGFLAAERALALLRNGPPREPAYEVLDFHWGRHMGLGAGPDSACPVCAAGASREPERLPEPTCRVGHPPTLPYAGEVDATLDLRAVSCPLTCCGRAKRSLGKRSVVTCACAWARRAR